MTLYDVSVVSYIKSRDWPVGLEYRVLWFEECLKVQLYRQNINSLDSDAKLHLATVLNETLNAIRNNGLPIYTWVAAGWGRDYNDDGSPREQ